MAAIQEAQSRQSAQGAYSSDPVRRPQPLRSGRHGTTRLHLQEHRAMIEVAAGLVFRSGKLLITQRYPEAHLGGLWEFPGGKREPQESFSECLQRELMEELGIEVEVLDLVETITHEYP